MGSTGLNWFHSLSQGHRLFLCVAQLSSRFPPFSIFGPFKLNQPRMPFLSYGHRASENVLNKDRGLANERNFPCVVLIDVGIAALGAKRRGSARRGCGFGPGLGFVRRVRLSLLRAKRRCCYCFSRTSGNSDGSCGFMLVFFGFILRVLCFIPRHRHGDSESTLRREFLSRGQDYID